MRRNEIESFRRRSREILDDAVKLFEAKGSLLSVVNRIYYALFYEVSGLLLTRGLSYTKHKGVRTDFNKLFIKTDLINQEFGDFYNGMFDLRSKGDYDLDASFDEDEVREWLEQAGEFLDEIDGLIADEIGC